MSFFSEPHKEAPPMQSHSPDLLALLLLPALLLLVFGLLSCREPKDTEVKTEGGPSRGNCSLLYSQFNWKAVEFSVRRHLLLWSFH